MIEKFDKYQIATAIAILFHAIGLIGILFFDKIFFINATPFNLLLSFALLIWTQTDKNLPFWIFVFAVGGIGFFVEAVGVNTGYLFGDYSYGNVLGMKAYNVPIIIGINWFIIIYSSGICMFTFLQKMISKLGAEPTKSPKRLRIISVIVDGATLAVLLDLMMEPVAIKLGLWKWEADGLIPLFNYVTWFVVSSLLLTIFQFCNFNKQNKFAVNLLLIQAMFFLVLRTFLK